LGVGRGASNPILENFTVTKPTQWRGPWRRQRPTQNCSSSKEEEEEEEEFNTLKTLSYPSCMAVITGMASEKSVTNIRKNLTFELRWK
jgi:hypothetical protein